MRAAEPSHRGRRRAAARERGRRSPLRMKAEPTPGSIGWLWPEETAREAAVAAAGGGGRRAGSAEGAAGAIALPRWSPSGAVVLAGAGLVIGMSLHSTPSPPPARTPSQAPKATAPAPQGSCDACHHANARYPDSRSCDCG